MAFCTFISGGLLQRDRSVTASSSQSDPRYYASTSASAVLGADSSAAYSKTEYSYITTTQRPRVDFAQDSDATDILTASMSAACRLESQERNPTQSSSAEKHTIESDCGDRPLTVVSLYPEDLKRITPTYASLVDHQTPVGDKETAGGEDQEKIVQRDSHLYEVQDCRNVCPEENKQSSDEVAAETSNENTASQSIPHPQPSIKSDISYENSDDAVISNDSHCEDKESHTNTVDSAGHRKIQLQCSSTSQLSYENSDMGANTTLNVRNSPVTPDGGRVEVTVGSSDQIEVCRAGNSHDNSASSSPISQTETTGTSCGEKEGSVSAKLPQHDDNYPEQATSNLRQLPRQERVDSRASNCL